MTMDWSSAEVLKEVFLFLDGRDLVTCMLVCKQWREIAKDDYFWKCLCARRWPSICKRRLASSLSYHKLFLSFSLQQRPQSLPPPKLCFEKLEFYIDIWSENIVIFSEAVSGSLLRSGIQNPPAGICDGLRAHLDGAMDTTDCKMMMPINPKLTIPLGKNVNASILVGRKDTNKMACIIRQSIFDYVDSDASRALAYDYLRFSPLHPFVPEIRAWLCLLLMANDKEGLVDVFGIELDFYDAACSDVEVLWLLDMLDWK